jgi:hypothetical protein
MNDSSDSSKEEDTVEKFAADLKARLMILTPRPGEFKLPKRRPPAPETPTTPTAETPTGSPQTKPDEQ